MTLQHTADHRGRHGTEHRAGQQGESSSTVPAVKIAIAMMNRVFVANLRTMNGELGIDTDSN